MLKSIKSNMSIELVHLFCCTPGLSNESADICPQHGTGVVEAKDWIPGLLFEFSLGRDCGPSAEDCFVKCFWEKSLHILGIVGI